MSDRQALRKVIGTLLAIALVILLIRLSISLYAPEKQPPSIAIWKQTRGPSGGKINALLLNEQNPSVIYAATDGGIYTSRDGGGTWQCTSAGLPAGQEVTTLAMAQTTPQTLYAGTFNGVYRSMDDGQTWLPATSGLTHSPVFSLVVDPQDSSIIYAGTEKQVFKSLDAGNTWSASSEGLPEETIWALAIDRTSPNILYVGTDSGVFKSTDQGIHWQRASADMPDNLRVQTLVIDPVVSSILYAATESGVYRSNNGAATWQAATGGIGEMIVHSLVIDPNNPRTLYAAVGMQGVWRSINSGESWEPVTGNINELVLALAIHPLHSQVLYAGTGRGVYYTGTGGQHWEPRNEGLISTNVLSLVAVPERPGHFYALTGLDVFKTTDDGNTWVSVTRGLARPNVLALAVDPDFPDTLYAGTWYSEIYRSADGGQTWWLVNGGLARDAPISALVVHRPAKLHGNQSSGVLYAGTNGAGVFYSEDGGIHWTNANNGLENLYVQTLALAPTEGGTLYAGTGKGLYRLKLTSTSEPSSSRWEVIHNRLAQDEVHSIVVDERSPNVIYVATATGIGEVYCSIDGGNTWTAIGRGSLPTNIKIQALALNPYRGKPRILYASTDGGIFRSDDGGFNWCAINEGLPARANVLALLVDAKRSYLYASIKNNGIYSSVDKGLSPAIWRLVVAGMMGTAALALILLTVQWHIQSSRQAQDQLFERNWPLWREEIERVLRDKNVVNMEALTHVPGIFKLRAMQQYMQEHGDDNLVLRLNPPVLEPTNAMQVGNFLRNWRAAQKRTKSAIAFKPMVSRITDQLCQLLGFTLLETRSYKDFHAYVIKAPALRLKMPPMFPIIFLQKPSLTEQDIHDLHDLLGILNISSYLALLVLPDSGTGQELTTTKALFKKLTRGTAHDFIVMDFDDLYRIFVAKNPEKRFIRILLAQIDLTVVSPYVISGPVPENMFFGRDYELKTITRMIKDNNFAIVGGRKIGKTSILNKLHRSFTDAPDTYSLYLDCQAVQDYQDLGNIVETLWQVVLPDCSPEALMRMIVRMKREQEDRLIVILMDEVDALLQHDALNQERLFKVFRALAQEHQCRFILCGGKVLHARLHDPNSALFNFCNVLRLSNLSPRDTGRIVMEPMQEMGIGFEDASKLVQAVINLSACHPNLVQYICQELIVRINARGDRFITLSELEAIGNSRQFNEYLIEVMWGNTTALERLITLLIMVDTPHATCAEIEAALHARGVQVPSAAVEQALDTLVLYSILNREGPEYCFTAPAFPSIVAATQDMDSLVERTIQYLSAEAIAT
nr:TniB family NTP-binding protein [Chloroflexota bacterium]